MQLHDMVSSFEVSIVRLLYDQRGCWVFRSLEEWHQP